MRRLVLLELLELRQFSVPLVAPTIAKFVPPASEGRNGRPGLTVFQRYSTATGPWPVADRAAIHGASPNP